MPYDRGYSVHISSLTLLLELFFRSLNSRSISTTWLVFTAELKPPASAVRLGRTLIAYIGYCPDAIPALLELNRRSRQ